MALVQWCSGYVSSLRDGVFSQQGAQLTSDAFEAAAISQCAL